MAEDSVPTAAEYALFREAYAETYPVRPLLNAIDAKDAEFERLQTKYAAQCNRWAHCRAALDQIRQHKHLGPCTLVCAAHLVDVANMAVIADDTDDGPATESRDE
jgi:hypothetical protein